MAWFRFYVSQGDYLNEITIDFDSTRIDNERL